MNVWEIGHDSDAESIDGNRMAESMDLEVFRKADGRSLVDIWRAPDIMTFSLGSSGRKKKRQPPLSLRADAPWAFSELLLLRNRARQAIQSMLDSFGEWLPAVSLDEEPAYWVFNPTVVLDGIDRESSVYSRLNSGRVFAIDKLVIRDDFEPSVPIFRLHGHPSRDIFGNDLFRDEWTSRGLTGLDFRRVLRTSELT